MFTNLIESASHQGELTRKGRFFLATLAGYAVVVMFVGVVSIYAYDAQLENQNLELTILVAPVATPLAPEEATTRPTTNAPSAGSENIPSEIREAVSPINDPLNPPEAVSSLASTVPELPPGFKVTGRNLPGTGGPFDPSLPVGPGTSVAGTQTGTPVVDIGAPPVRPDPPKPKTIVSEGVINGQAIQPMPKPVYPELARRGGAQGVVSVQILVDEKGKVISARALGGHVLLRQAAEQAAMQTRFSPTKLSGVPVKVSGTITFNFVLNR